MRRCGADGGALWARQFGTAEDDQLWAAQPPATSYGLGFGVGGSEGARVISHTGAQEGTRTAILIYPDEGRCYVFMTNSSWADPAAYARILRNSEPR